MKLSYLQSIALAGLLGCCSGARADGSGESNGSEGESSDTKAALLPVRSAVLVKEVRGHVEYAYDSTGWRVLTTGKQLQPGATVRAGLGSVAILRITESANFFKVSPSTEVYITNETPDEELGTISLASVKATIFASAE